MKADFTLSSIKKRHGRFVRAVAVFFLLFTGADILMPQYFCDDEIGGISLPTTAATLNTEERSAGDGQLLAASMTPADSRPGPQPDQGPHEEDCFCCCAHVLPGLAFTTVGISEMRLPSAPFVRPTLLSPPLRGTYHPPRIA